MTDDRLAQLERLVYGAGASDEERANAARELHELRSAPESPATDPEGAPAEGSAVEGATAETSVAAAPDVQAGASTGLHRRVRRVIIAATAALVVGVLAGWQLGAREAEQTAEHEAELAAESASAFPGPRTQADYLASLPVAAESPAVDVFLRPATAADSPAVGHGMDFGNGPLEFRLLATRADGLPVYAARDDSELCLFVAFNEDGGTATCTTDGRFPAEGLQLNSGGLQLDGSVSGTTSPSIDVTWRPDGSVAMNTLAG